jgi:hypothetical protein
MKLLKWLKLAGRLEIGNVKAIEVELKLHDVVPAQKLNSDLLELELRIPTIFVLLNAYDDRACRAKLWRGRTANQLLHTPFLTCLLPKSPLFPRAVAAVSPHTREAVEPV